MKKIYMLSALLLISAAGFAQTKINHSFKLQEATKVSRPVDNSRQNTDNIWMDYDSADSYVAHSVQGAGSRQKYLIWWLNKNFTDANSNTIQRTVVRFNDIVDMNTATIYNDTFVTGFNVDSFYVEISHKNTSGLTNKFIGKILNLDANRYPGNTVLWADTLTATTSLSPGGDLNQVGFLTFRPNFFVNTNGFAIEFEFNAPTQDTLGIIIGFNNKGACAAQGTNFSANYSYFYYNSYVAVSGYTSTYPLLPAADSSDLFVDCNGDHNPDAGDGASWFQNIILGAYAKVYSTSVSVNDLQNLGFGLSQNIPNPAHNSSDIKYELAKDAKNVNLVVYDLIGNKVMEVNEGNRPAGKYAVTLNTSLLAKGMYMYSLRVDGAQLTKKMIIE